MKKLSKLVEEYKIVETNEGFAIKKVLRIKGNKYTLVSVHSYYGDSFSLQVNNNPIKFFNSCELMLEYTLFLTKH